jgi:hypothetical protein
MGKTHPAVSVSERHSESLEPTKAQKRRERLLKNQQLAKDYRVRYKARVQQLEAQVRQLSEEAAELRGLAEKAKEVHSDDQVTEVRDAFFEQISSAATNPACADEEISTLMDELADTVGPRGPVFLECLRSTFQRTVAMMVPECVMLCLALNEGKLPEVHSMLKASLGAQQYELFATMQQESKVELLAVAQALGNFKEVAGEIWHYTDVLHSLIRTRFRSIMQPRQCARMVMRLHKLFRHLKAEEVLNYGRNSSELLKEA